MNRKLALLFITVCFLSGLVLAQDPAIPAGGPPQGAAGAQAGAPGGRGGAPRGRGGPALPANQPAARDDARHKGFVEIAQRGNIDLLWVGDSITDWWARGGQQVWEQNFASLKPANFGIAGDTTQGVLWRMQNGELEGFTAKLIVHMLGTNNINRNPVDEIVDGNRLILEEFKKRQPQAKVLLLGVFPRNADPANPLRATIKEINSKLASLADGNRIVFMDIGDKFLTPEGALTTEVMADGLHPTAKGYQIWADAVRDTIKAMMQ
jgi:lysophospholipase L1-like esterase